MLDLAMRAAREAGAILQEYAAREFQITHKGRINLVTEADLASEKHIKELIQTSYPTHRILAEESGASHADASASDYCWIIDPLDGTTNFAHGLPSYAVSIGLEHKGKMIAGVIYDPTRNDMFAAERGAGAMLNGERIKVSDVDSLEQSLLVTGFPYDVREKMNVYLPPWRLFLERAQGVRRLGAAAIDIAYVACGRFEGFWENGLHAWDCAAGWVIVEEAGGRVTKFDGSPFELFQPLFLCTNNRIHDQMIEVLREAAQS